MIYAKTPFIGSVCRFARIHVNGCLLSRSHNVPRANTFVHHSFVDATFFVFDSFIMCNVMTKTCILLNCTGSCIPFFFVLVLIFFFTSGWILSTFFFSIFFGLCTCFIRWLLFHMVPYILIHAFKLCMDVHLYICTCMFMAFMKHT